MVRPVLHPVVLHPVVLHPVVLHPVVMVRPVVVAMVRPVLHPVAMVLPALHPADMVRLVVVATVHLAAAMGRRGARRRLAAASHHLPTNPVRHRPVGGRASKRPRRLLSAGQR